MADAYVSHWEVLVKRRRLIERVLAMVEQSSITVASPVEAAEESPGGSLRSTAPWTVW
jgi:hypothetical protein